MTSVLILFSTPLSLYTPYRMFSLRYIPMQFSEAYRTQFVKYNHKLNLNIKLPIRSHLHLYCRGTSQTCLFLWFVCVCVSRHPCWGVSAATEPETCRPSDHPDSSVRAAPRGPCHRTSPGPQSGERMWEKKGHQNHQGKGFLLYLVD